MQKRSCPVCKTSDSNIIMKFTPEVITEMNNTYRPEIFRELINNEHDLLHYSQCNACHAIYTDHLWDNEFLSKVYDNVINHDKSYQKVLSISKRMELLREWMGILRVLHFNGNRKLEGLKLIDYGCGWGDFLDTVWGYGIQPAGFDQDKKKIAGAKSRGHKIYDTLEELKSFGPVDVFVMNSVLEHLQDVDSTLSFAKGLLNDDGIIVILVMDYRDGFIKRNINNLKKNKPAITKNLNPIEHVNIYNYHTLYKTLTNAGFKFITTGVSLTFTDYPFLRNSYFILKLANLFERISAKYINSFELGITMYATPGNKQ